MGNFVFLTSSLLALMNRRKFIESAGMIGALTVLPLPFFSMTEKPKYKLGYQLYSIRDEMAKDPINTLKALKGMGYEDFEHYGFDSGKGTYYGFDASEFKALLDEMELSISSGHYPFSDFLLKPDDALKRYVDSCIAGALTMNSRYITWPWLAPEFRNVEGYKKTSEKLNVISEQIKSAGLGLAYHNHGYEFDDFNGENGYDIITSETDSDLVKLQLDMYWLARSSNFTPSEIISKHPGRFVMWHIKDMHKVTEDYTELGNGSIDYINLLPDPAVSGLEYYYIEQGGNFTINSLQSAEDSATYLKKHLQRFL